MQDSGRLVELAELHVLVDAYSSFAKPWWVRPHVPVRGYFVTDTLLSDALPELIAATRKLLKTKRRQVMSLVSLHASANGDGYCCIHPVLLK